MKVSRKVPVPRYKKILIPTGIVLLLFAGLFGVLKFKDVFSEKPSQPIAKNDTQQTDTQSTDKKDSADTVPEPQSTTEIAQSPSNPAISEPGNIWWVVNKTRPLSPLKYTPDELVYPNVSLRVPGNESMKIRSDVAKAIQQMFADAKKAGLNPLFSSGYRSYNYQVTLYNGYVNSDGQAEADKQSARPGYSEHQTGLSFDICDANNCQLEQAFVDTPLGKWVAENAYKYGFTIRYKENKQDITGYIYEPWHLRYVGLDLAKEVHKTNQTLEEFFKLSPAPDYQ